MSPTYTLTEDCALGMAMTKTCWQSCWVLTVEQSSCICFNSEQSGHS